VLVGCEGGRDPDGVDRQGVYLVRYNPDGTLDSGFASSGVAYLVNPAGLLGEHPAGVAVQSDGQIVAGGNLADVNSPAQQNYFFALRVSATGGLDTGFGSGGWASTQIGYGGTGTALGLALEPDGRVVVAGRAEPTSTSATDVAMVRFLSSAPQVGSLTANGAAGSATVASGSTVTLAASAITDGNPGVTIQQVTFYYIDGSGTQQVLGYGTQSSGVWTLNYTVSLVSGTYTLYAQAEDNYNVLGDPMALTLVVQ